MEVSSQTKKKINNLRLSAFTLAEVLITLGIIGMIANMTLPALFNSVGEKQNKVAWVKKYSEINQVIKRMNADYLIPFDSQVVFNNSFGDYLSYSKKCAHSITDGCWHTNWYNLEGVKIVTSYFNKTGYILSDGSLFVLIDTAMAGTKEQTILLPNNSMPFVIDVNGFKGPNKNGYDIFGGWLRADSIYLPTGPGPCDRTNFTYNSWGADIACSRKVILGEDY